MSWTTIESDPGVFSELIQQFGVKDVKVEEIWDLSPEGLASVGQVHGLIFLFRYDTAIESTRREDLSFVDDPSVFFANQVSHDTRLVRLNGVRTLRSLLDGVCR